MDNRMALLSGILALLMVSSGFFLVLDGDTDNEQEESELNQESESPVVNTPPNILAPENYQFVWDGTNTSITGFVTDESPSTASVQAILLDAVSLAQIGPVMEAVIDMEGAWSIQTTESEPGSWILQIQATDLEGEKSNLTLSELHILPPVENDVILTFLWIAPAENSSIGSVQGFMAHSFPSTCAVEYHPLGQSPARLIDADENTTTGTYSLNVNTSYHNTEGDLIATCGMFTESSSSIRVNFPSPPEPETDLDSDGILDDSDLCDGTPEGEPVYANGCSDSETDDDEDGVMNTMDLCPNTLTTESVDANGCSESQKDDDNDGVVNSLDQCPNTPETELADSNGCSNTQRDTDGDGVNDASDACPNTPQGTQVGTDGCALAEWSKEDSLLCLDGEGAWAKDLNGDGNNYNANTNGAAQEGGGGSGPWFQCIMSVSMTSSNMEISSNSIPNHDWLSTYAQGADEQSISFTIPLQPVNDTSGGHDSTNCPASNGDYECAPDRGSVAVAVNGVPIFGPEEGPGGDAVALEYFYFEEDRQPIDLGYCGAHNGPSGVHYHYDAMCQHWIPGNGESITDYDHTLLDSTQHSPIVGWAFDGYPIYGMYGWTEDGSVKAMKSSYEVELSSENGDQGYNGIDDWNYVENLGDLDMCNGRFGPTPEYPEGTYHYVSTPVSASTKSVVDTNGDTVPMLGFPYFLLCFHGEADMSNADAGGPPGGGGGPPGANAAQTLYTHMPELLDAVETNEENAGYLWNASCAFLALAGIAFIRSRHN
jgi:hypothetical protein